MKQTADKSEEAGLLNPDKALAEVQATPVGAQRCATTSIELSNSPTNGKLPTSM